MFDKVDEPKRYRIATFVSGWRPVVVQFNGTRACTIADHDIARFLAQTDIDPDGCWTWTGSADGSNYGVVRAGGVQGKAYRLSFAIFNGPIPAGFHIDHECHNEALARGDCIGGKSCPHRRCVNPRHLRIATPRENVLRSASFVAANARKTHCANGHPFDGEYLYIYPDGSRGCRQCRRDAEARSVRRRAAEAGREVLPLPADRTHCRNGHPYDAENTRISPSTGRRACKICANEKSRRSRQRIKEKRRLLGESVDIGNGVATAPTTP